MTDFSILSYISTEWNPYPFIYLKPEKGTPCRVLSRIYRLGEKSQVAEGPSFLGGSGGMVPWKFFEMNMRWDAIWCILRHNFEKCCSLCTALAVSGWFFRYSYLYSVMITIWAFWGGSFYPSNTLDRTLPCERSLPGSTPRAYSKLMRQWAHRNF